MIQNLNFEEAHALIESTPDILILDVREEEEFITGHAPDAVLLPYESINETTAKEVIPAYDTPVMVYCRSGRRSRIAAEHLDALGYTEIYDLGSFIGWPYGLE
ncbi:MAG: rhodanese-like domain-containing protein [Clostridia bacterium]|nr:rhodanese-like domain-containing protein [Clostridia bacterium]